MRAITSPALTCGVVLDGNARRRSRRPWATGSCSGPDVGVIGRHHVASGRPPGVTEVGPGAQRQSADHSERPRASASGAQALPGRLDLPPPPARRTRTALASAGPRPLDRSAPPAAHDRPACCYSLQKLGIPKLTEPFGHDLDVRHEKAYVNDRTVRSMICDGAELKDKGNGHAGNSEPLGSRRQRAAKAPSGGRSSMARARSSWSAGSMRPAWAKSRARPASPRARCTSTSRARRSCSRPSWRDSAACRASRFSLSMPMTAMWRPC